MGAFQVIRSQGWGPHNGMGALLREAPESSAAPSASRGQRAGSRPPPDSLDLRPPELSERNVRCLSPPVPGLLVLDARTALAGAGAGRREGRVFPARGAVFLRHSRPLQASSFREGLSLSSCPSRPGQWQPHAAASSRAASPAPFARATRPLCRSPLSLRRGPVSCSPPDAAAIPLGLGQTWAQTSLLGSHVTSG